MSDNLINSHRIAKNTILLYCRMLIGMFVSLYTSRIVLNSLGVEDYGIYNVVGSIVAMSKVLSGALSASISRFFSFEIGNRDKNKLHIVFSSAIIVQIALVIIIIILLETTGLWFLNNRLIIPSNRLYAAHWVFHFSVFAFAINMTSIPYNASIIAHERMSAFAYISILEVVGKLLIAFCINYSPIDKLIFYSLILTVIAIVVRMVYRNYCVKHFEECRLKIIWDQKSLGDIIRFSGWNFFGAISAVVREQGGNILVNIFSGPSVNAAKAIASQVNTAISGFVTNFMTAINPQITKSYASGQFSYMLNLVTQGARLSYFIFLLIALPVFFNTNYILQIWLGNVPEYTISFVRLIIVFIMCESISNPLTIAILATGKIRKYQIVTGTIQLMNFPCSLLFLKLGITPSIVYIVAIILSLCCQIFALYLLKKNLQLSIRKFIKDVYVNIIPPTLTALLFPSLFILFKCHNNTFISFTINCIIILCSTTLSIYLIALKKSEKEFLKNKLSTLFEKMRINY